MRGWKCTCAESNLALPHGRHTCRRKDGAVTYCVLQPEEPNDTAVSDRRYSDKFVHYGQKSHNNGLYQLRGDGVTRAGGNAVLRGVEAVHCSHAIRTHPTSRQPQGGGL